MGQKKKIKNKHQKVKHFTDCCNINDIQTNYISSGKKKKEGKENS